MTSFLQASSSKALRDALSELAILDLKSHQDNQQVHTAERVSYNLTDLAAGHTLLLAWLHCSEVCTRNKTASCPLNNSRQQRQQFVATSAAFYPKSVSLRTLAVTNTA